MQLTIFQTVVFVVLVLYVGYNMVFALVEHISTLLSLFHRRERNY